MAQNSSVKCFTLQGVAKITNTSWGRNLNLSLINIKNSYRGAFGFFSNAAYVRHHAAVGFCQACDQFLFRNWSLPVFGIHLCYLSDFRLIKYNFFPVFFFLNVQFWQPSCCFAFITWYDTDISSTLEQLLLYLSRNQRWLLIDEKTGAVAALSLLETPHTSDARMFTAVHQMVHGRNWSNLHQILILK